jgi:hypothetical protein
MFNLNLTHMDRAYIVSSTHRHRMMIYRTNIIRSISTTTMGRGLVPTCRPVSMANNISSRRCTVPVKEYKASLALDIILVLRLLLNVGRLRRRISRMLPKAKTSVLAWELDKLALGQHLRQGRAFSNLNKPHFIVGIIGLEVLREGVVHKAASRSNTNIISPKAKVLRATLGTHKGQERQASTRISQGASKATGSNWDIFLVSFHFVLDFHLFVCFTVSHFLSHSPHTFKL